MFGEVGVLDMQMVLDWLSRFIQKKKKKIVIKVKESQLW